MWSVTPGYVQSSNFRLVLKQIECISWTGGLPCVHHTTKLDGDAVLSSEEIERSKVANTSTATVWRILHRSQPSWMHWWAILERLLFNKRPVCWWKDCHSCFKKNSKRPLVHHWYATYVGYLQVATLHTLNNSVHCAVGCTRRLQRSLL